MYWRYQKVIGNFNLDAQDCAASLYRIAAMFVPQVPEIIVSSNNFVATNGILYTGKSSNAHVSKIFQDILRTESGGAVPTLPNEASYWAMWVDALRQAHHEQVLTQNMAAATIQVDLLGNTSTYGDIAAPLEPTDMDITQLVNCTLVYGGKNAQGQQVVIILTHKPSYTQWGYYEDVLSNPNITDPTALATWAAGQVGVLGWPRNVGRLKLLYASLRMTARDLLEIVGFADGSKLTTNPTEIRYTVKMLDRACTAMISLTQQQPNIASIIAEINAQKSIRQLTTSAMTNLASGVVSGLIPSVSGLTWSITAGTVMYGGITYSIASASGTMTDGSVLALGAQVGGTPPSGSTVPCIAPLPSFQAVSKMHALHNWFELQTPSSGGSLNLIQQTDFVGVELANFTALGGIIQVADLASRVSSGIGGNNLMPITPGQTPEISNVTVTVHGEGATMAYAQITATVAGLVFDETVRSIGVTYSIAGQNQWHPDYALVYNPTTGVISGILLGFAAGQAYDLALVIRGQNGIALGDPIMLTASPTITAAEIAVAISVLSMAAMPPGATFTVAAVTESTFDAGMVRTL